MNSALGSNLSELDRLLLELNAVQQSAPAFPTEGTRCLIISNINASLPKAWCIKVINVLVL